MYVFMKCNSMYDSYKLALSLTAWMEVDYNPERHVCICFDGTFPLKYTLAPVIVGHLLPHCVTVFCYFKILKVKKKTDSACVS